MTYSAEDQAIYDRNTYQGPLPGRSTLPTKEQAKVHPLAGRTPGVRSTSRQALKTVKLSDDEHQVYIALTMHDEPMCDHELLAYLKANTTKGNRWEINQVNGRRHGLLKKGCIKEAGNYPCSRTPNRVIHWRTSEASE